ncbi:MAG: hypothetical protein WDO13_04630 [Verrucomicrobiota bacterium]
MKYVILLFLTSVALVTLNACSDSQTTASTTQTAPLQPDTKEIKK